MQKFMLFSTELHDTTMKRVAQPKLLLAEFLPPKINRNKFSIERHCDRRGRTCHPHFSTSLRYHACAVYIIFFTWISCSFIVTANAQECLTIEYQEKSVQLSALRWIFPVSVYYQDNNETVSYYFNLCQHSAEDGSDLRKSRGVLPKECNGSLICAVSDKPGSSVLRYEQLFLEGNISSIDNATAQSSGTQLLFSTDEPIANCSDDGMAQLQINPECGNHLGFPEFLSKNRCSVLFAWSSYAFCDDGDSILKTEVPCYTFEGTKRIDLSPLIQSRGGYHVETGGLGNVEDMIINVCSDIVSAVQETAKPYSRLICPGTSSCVMIGGQFQSSGSVVSPLEFMEEGQSRLVYRSNVIPRGCSTKAQTTILFRCRRRTLNQAPKLMAVAGCHYEVVWETEFACPTESMLGDAKQCKFDRDEEGIHIDLSPLRKPGGAYVATGKLDDLSILFYLNPCQALQTDGDCKEPWTTNAVCMRDFTNRTKNIGTTSQALFRYVDGKLVLSYGGGEKCTKLVSWETVIEFTCDENAGVGNPVFVKEQDCVFYFVWPTEHACIQSSTDHINCYVSMGDTQIDLSVLRRNTDTWISSYNSDKEVFLNYINVCGPIPNIKELQQCGKDAAACRKTVGSGQLVSLGKFASPPTYVAESKEVKLIYEEGGACDGGKRKIRSVFLMKCIPGDLESKPILKNITDEGCLYTFKWDTAAACPLAPMTGTECILFNSELGFYYDFRSLASDTYYKISAGDYAYYLNVCGKLKGTPCNERSNLSISACQVETKSGKSWNLGEDSSTLIYVGRKIMLKYQRRTPDDDRHGNTPESASITFICDPAAGKGTPKFDLAKGLGKQPTFVWHTHMACPSLAASKVMAFNCFNKSPRIGGAEYDLSDLASIHKPPWIVHHLIPASEGQPPTLLKFYLSVCHSLLPASKFCELGAAACVTKVEMPQDGNMTNAKDGKEVAYIPDLGQVGSFVVNDSDRIGPVSIIYHSHDMLCTNEGENKKYTTTIQFICSDALEEGQPRFHERIGGCTFVFQWRTHYACPISQVSTKNKCKVSDSRSGYVYDLSGLHLPEGSAPYSVTAGGKTYQMNICGPLTSGPCAKTKGSKDAEWAAICETDAEGKEGTAIGLVGTAVLSKGKDLHMELQGEMDPSGITAKVLIKFVCSQDSELDHPTLLLIGKTQFGKYAFQMATPLACRPRNEFCTFTDPNGNEYDLTPLARQGLGSNWEQDAFGSKFFINFCRPINRVFDNMSPSSKCPGATTEACAVTDGTAGFSLGSLQEKPTVNKDGTVIVHFEGGSPCGLSRGRAEITLVCHKMQSLIFIGHWKSVCRFFFRLQTPAACPVQRAIGSSCSVKDPESGHTFSLASLYKIGSNYRVSGRHGRYYLLNVCGPINDPPRGCKGSAVCQILNNGNIIAGKPNSNLILHNGVIRLVYTLGEQCLDVYNRTVVITFMCDRSTQQGPKFLREDVDCTYHFEWRTSLACPPERKQDDCLAKDEQGRAYNLKGLLRTSDNYEVFPPGSPGKRFVLNVCTNVVLGKGARCPYSSASCMIQNDARTGVLLSVNNLGQLHGGPYFENGILQLRYTSGDACTIRGMEEQTMQTVIQFFCDPMMTNSEPEFANQKDCTYYFSWVTVYACPPVVAREGDVGPLPAMESSNCSFINQMTGLQVDLSPLMQHNPYIVRDTQKHEYHLSVCAKLTGERSNVCNEHGTGVCQYEFKGSGQGWNAGIASADLQFVREGVYELTYQRGNICFSYYRRSAVIRFICDLRQKSHGEPIFAEESDYCKYKFEWRTPLACGRELQCAVTVNDHTIDLRQLSLSRGDYSTVAVISNDGTTSVTRFYINVCHQVNSERSGSCSSGAGVCMRTSDGGISLGSNKHPPFIDQDGHVTLVYTSGSSCNLERKYEARIKFICDPAVPKGYPVLVDVITNHCTYVFEWKTSVVCPPAPPAKPFTNSFCGIYNDPASGLLFDLSILRMPPSMPYEVKPDKWSNTFLLNVCGHVSDCGESRGGKQVSACLSSSGKKKIKDYGLMGETFYYNGSNLILKYFANDSWSRDGNQCGSADIVFVCNRKAAHGHPVLQEFSHCHTVFTWQTELVCTDSKRRKCVTVDSKGNVYSLRHLSSSTHAWHFWDRDGNQYWLNVCGALLPSVPGCESSNAAVCYRRRGGSRIVPLGTLDTQNLHYLDDDGSLILSYENGSSAACNASFSSKTVKVVINLKCGTMLREPELISGPKGRHCTFIFRWETIMACPVQMYQETVETNGVVHPKNYSIGFNLTHLLSTTFTVEERTPGRHFNYVINLNNTSSSMANSTACSKAAVCQVEANGSSSWDIGTLRTRTFSIIGSVFAPHFQMRLTSHGKTCGVGESGQKTASSIFFLQCSRTAGLDRLQFLYENQDCEFVFVWNTNAVCLEKLKLGDRKSNETGTPSKSVQEDSNGSTDRAGSLVTAVVVLVVLCVILCIILIFTMGKKLKRQYLMLKSFTFRYKRTHEELSNADDEGECHIMH